jgi:putative ABC transport system permease protein
VPGIAGATPINVPPFTGQGWDVPQFSAEGQDADRAVANPSLNLESIHPNYFATLQVPIVRGRAFTNADREGAPHVAIVSADVASRVWPREDPVGKRIKMARPGSPGEWYTIVGVAEPTRYRTVMGPRPTLYLPAAQFQMTATAMAVRSAAKKSGQNTGQSTGQSTVRSTATVEQLTSLIAERIGSIDRDVRVMRVTPFTEMLARPLAQPTFNALLLIVFSIAALLLPAIGLYAVMAAYVRQRDREIAVRLALGATARTIRLMVAAEAGRLAGAGVLLGIAGAIAGTRALRGMLFEVEPFDPLSLTVAVLLLVCAAALAFHQPLRRAARADIMTVLRSD